jgi:hypothetical protein
MACSSSAAAPLLQRKVSGWQKDEMGFPPEFS